MTKFINAIYHPDILTVEYVAENGDRLLRSGGTIAWRFNNPGNLRPGSKYTLHIGQGTTKSGAFLIFPTAEAGRTEKKGLLLRKYKNDSVAQMMELYAPRTENDTDKYVDYITTQSGVGKEAIVGKLSEAELDALMQAMERYEGFHAKADTRKETWVRTTKITLSDGARPIAGQEVTIKQGTITTQHKTNIYGQLPAIPHLQPGEQVELWIKNAAHELEKMDSFILGQASQTFTYFTDVFSAQATTRSHLPASAREKKKPAPFSYVVQPGDTVGKIAKKFKTNADKIVADNKLKNRNQIFPGQRLSINGSSSTSNNEPMAKSSGRTSKPIHTTATPERSKEGQGHPIAIIPSDQKRAPWMEIAVREAKQWGGAKEKVITKTDNYHKEIGLSGNLGSTPWCASFVNYCLKDSGYPYEKSASSQFPVSSSNFKKIDKPIYGAILVMKNFYAGTNKEHGTGHVTFVYGITQNGRIAALGGNQGDRIKLSGYSQSGTSSTFVVSSGTHKVKLEQRFYSLYIPVTYSNFSEHESSAAIIDIDMVNKEFFGVSQNKLSSSESTR